ncbi:hypothetical protein BK727_16985 [Bacillus thuringiensis serovar roskildiensis]|uniref:Uncharacterized protein n=1 Tax=Bacillus thuringiensis serovar sooncheon TaxID=180891 RepID=A0A9Q5X4F1_BACTU|nr:MULTISPECIES: hypothetical protein [Bacillus]MDC7973875.1 hypothetical protein [Bacillus sp. BLCC-B18]OTW67884.1 hypothetical protein BK707_22290 [Bacillus thuringiensis serovar coreanensis]OTX44501.1 hypothetical protein BK724_17585 [Bacillus thuringiensis serovar sooncheon]OTX53664.1 hypothetical protein BK725_15970 [Bacillus thuringiensis serovar guiyangiensis]OTX67984.1 hypothetical protein BK727_16985 [Bacillus thuringiensis serovar roskildiensis]
MVILLKYECWKGSALEVKFVLGSIYFIITDEIGNFVYCVFSGSRAREFVKILTDNESTEILDRGGDLMRLQSFKGGGFGISINSKKMTKGFAMNQQQIQELIDFCQKIHKL